MTACRYCKSPSPGRPCWYFTDNPERLQSGGDPPCLLYGDPYDLWDQDAQARRREKKRRTKALLIVAILIGAGILLYALSR